MGSGSSKNERVGRAGGGGNLDPANIVSTESLVSARGKYQQQVDDVLTTAKDFTEQYGDMAILNDLQIAVLKGRDKLTMGYYDGGDNVTLNADMFKTNFDPIYDKGGNHNVNRGNKSAIQAVTSHEIGHALTSRIGSKIGINNIDKVSDIVVKEAVKNTKHRGVVQMANQISRYATSSNAEALAEAVCDVYCNGKKAKSESKAIVNVMNKYLKG